MREMAPAHLSMCEESERQIISDMVTALDDWADELYPLSSKDELSRCKYSSALLLECLRMSKLVRGGASRLVEIMERSLRIALPSLADASGRVTLGVKLPSRQLLQYAELAIDIAICRLAQKWFKAGTYARFSMADSSELCGYNWLWQHQRLVPFAGMWQAFEAANQLINVVESFAAEIPELEGDSDRINDLELTKPRDSWMPLLEIIKANVIDYVPPPCSMGPGHAAVQHKCEALAWSWAIQTPLVESMDGIADDFRTHTSDMGTELSCPEFRVRSVASIFPAWYDRQLMTSDVQAPGTPIVDGVVDAQPQGPEAVRLNLRSAHDDHVHDVNGPMLPASSDEELDGEPEIASSHAASVAVMSDVEPLMPNSPSASEVAGAPVLGVDEPSVDNNVDPFADEGFRFFMDRSCTIAGIMHIIDNMLQDMHESLADWKWFHKQLKILEAFICNDPYRRRFCWTCLRGTPFEWALPKFKTFSAHLYEARWGEVLNFLKAIVPLLPILSRAWSEQLYAGFVDRGGTAQPRKDENQSLGGRTSFNPRELTRVVHDAYFIQYCTLCSVLDTVPTKFTKWIAVCPCHEPLMKHLSTHKRKQLLTRHYGSPHSCPLAGAWCPQLVAGKIDEIAEKVFAETEADVITQTACVGTVGHDPLQVERLERILNALRQAKAMFFFSWS